MQTDMLPGVEDLEGSQQHKALLLCNTAAARVQPTLEIATDTVSCAHGATVGSLDDKALFYLQSRAIEKNKAEQLLCAAFVQSIVPAKYNNQLSDILSVAVSEVTNG